MSSYRALLGNRNYRLWFLSSLGSSLGDWVGLFALQVLVVSLAEPGSRLALFGLGGIMMARLIPSVFFGPVAGVLADRYDRKRLMVTTDLARAALFVGIAFSRDLATLFTLTFVVECLSLLYVAAKDASLPQVVQRRHLTEANQLNLLVTYGPLPFGAVVASAMVALAGALGAIGLPDINATVLALLVNAGTFGVAGLLISGLQLPHRGRSRTSEEGGRGVLAELTEGFRFIQDLPVVRALITGICGIFFGAAVVVTLGPEFVRAELGRAPADWFGLMTAVGTGLLVGIAAVPLIASRVRKERLFPICMSGAGAIAVFVATLSSFRATQIAGFFLGGLVGLSIVAAYTVLHERTEDDVRARTFAALYTGTRIAMFAGLGLAPFLAGAIGTGTLIVGGRWITMSGVRITLLLGGLAALVSALMAGRAMSRALRQEALADPSRPVRLKGHSDEPPVARGVFVALEGVEGAGKSTQLEALRAALAAEGYDVLVTREPGGPPIAERIRQILLDPNAAGMDHRTEALLYAAARAEHVQRVILPALAEGKVVLCDRFVDSSLAYQGVARGLGTEDVFEINRWAIGGLLPDIVVLLYLDPQEGLHRVAERARRKAEPQAGDRARLAWEQRIPDRIEQENLEFHQRVAQGYLKIAKQERSRFVLVDASGDPEAVARQVRSGLHPWIPLPAPASGDATVDDAEPGDGAGRRPEAAG